MVPVSWAHRRRDDEWETLPDISPAAPDDPRLSEVEYQPYQIIRYIFLSCWITGYRTTMLFFALPLLTSPDTVFFPLSVPVCNEPAERSCLFLLPEKTEMTGAA